ncbi:MAG: hypothetical protein FWC32_01935 [Firmicutes bacterium]|nr:hypothetical protein [Bacillota bacterium]
MRHKVCQFVFYFVGGIIVLCILVLFFQFTMPFWGSSDYADDNISLHVLTTQAYVIVFFAIILVKLDTINKRLDKREDENDKNPD